jgi:hypothetical protein
MPTESWPGSAGTDISGDQTWTEFNADWVKNGDGTINAPVTSSVTVARMDVDVGTDHYAEVDVTNAAASAQTPGKGGPAVRVSEDGDTYYFFGSNNGQTSFGRSLYRIVNNGGGRIETQLNGNIDGNRLRLECVDNADGDPVLTCYIDGVMVYQHVDTSGSAIVGNTKTGVAKSSGTEGGTILYFSNFESGSLTETTPIGTYYQGAATSDGFTIAVQVQDTHDIRVAYATNEAMTSPSYTATFADQTGHVKLDVAGLNPATKYWWCFEVDGNLDDDARGSIKTAPAPGAGSFTFGAASCAGVVGAMDTLKAFRSMTNAPTFDYIAAHDPDMFVHMGDFHYRDVNTASAELYRAAYRDVLGNPRQAALWHSTNLAYVWDDHDYGDDVDSFSPTKAVALTTYKEMIPHYPLGPAGDVDEAPIGQTFVYGPARFIMLDARSGRDLTDSPPTILGDAQKAWLESVLATTDSRVNFITTGVPWISDSSSDTWFGATAERTEILDMLQTYDLVDKTIMIAGDMHGCAWDSGVNNHFATNGAAGPPVFQFAPLDGSNSVKGGPYSGGTFAALNRQYGFIEVNDSGDDLEVVVTAYGLASDGLSESQLFTTTLNFAGAPQPTDMVLSAPQLAHPSADVVITATKGLTAEDQTDAIQAQLTAITSGTEGNPTTVTMARGTYRVDGALTIDTKNYLDLWMHGVTFQATQDIALYDERRHFTIDRCVGVTVRGLTIVGSSPVAGTQDAAYVVAKEFQHGFRIYDSSQNILLTHCNVFDVWGDCVYVGAGSGNSGITVRKGEFRRNGRQCFAVVQGTDIEFADNVCSDIRRSWVDIEPNTAAQSVTNVRVLRNRLETSTAGSDGDGFTSTPQRLSFFANLGPASVESDFYFEDNYSQGRFNGSSGHESLARTNLVFRRNVFEAESGNPGGGALHCVNWDGIEFTDNVMPCEVRTPTMYIANSVSGSGEVDGGGNVWAPSTADGVFRLA